MTDTHSHIYAAEFDEDREEVVERARQAGVDRILLPNINEESIAPMLALCRQHPDCCFPMMGLHPEDVKEDYQDVLARMRALLEEKDNFRANESDRLRFAECSRKCPRDNPYIAVGEVGLDFYWDATRRKEQMDAFSQQVEWAATLGLPLVIHSRNAHRELVDVMRAHRGKVLRGVFHCFCGTLEEARELLEFEGFVLGIGGVLTYKKSTLPEVVRELPVERMVLETDSPYLAPVPHRGGRNESAYIVHVLERMAREKGLSEEHISAVMEETVRSIFSLTNRLAKH